MHLLCSTLFLLIFKIGGSILLWPKMPIFTIYLLQTSGKFPVESSSVDLVVLIWKSLDFPIDQLTQEVLRVLKAGGTTLIRKSSQSAVGSGDKVK